MFEVGRINVAVAVANLTCQLGRIFRHQVSLLVLDSTQVGEMVEVKCVELVVSVDQCCGLLSQLVSLCQVCEFVGSVIVGSVAFRLVGTVEAEIECALLLVLLANGSLVVLVALVGQLRVSYRVLVLIDTCAAVALSVVATLAAILQLVLAVLLESVLRSGSMRPS